MKLVIKIYMLLEVYFHTQELFKIVRKVTIFPLIMQAKSRRFSFEVSRLGGVGSFQRFYIELVKFGGSKPFRVLVLKMVGLMDLSLLEVWCLSLVGLGLLEV